MLGLLCCILLLACIHHGPQRLSSFDLGCHIVILLLLRGDQIRLLGGVGLNLSSSRQFLVHLSELLLRLLCDCITRRRRLLLFLLSASDFLARYGALVARRHDEFVLQVVR